MMATIQLETKDRSVQDSLSLLQTLLRGYGPRDFAVRFWDGTTWEPDSGREARFTLVLQHPGSVRKMFWPPGGSTLAEAYVYDDFDIEGDILPFFALTDHLRNLKLGWFEKARLVKRLLGLPSAGRARTGRQPARLQGPVHSRERD